MQVSMTDRTVALILDVREAHAILSASLTGALCHPSQPEAAHELVAILTKFVDGDEDEDEE